MLVHAPPPPGSQKNRCYSLAQYKVIGVHDAAAGNGVDKDPWQLKELKNVAFGLLATWAITTAAPVVAANQVRRCYHFPFQLGIIMQLFRFKN